MKIEHFAALDLFDSNSIHIYETHGNTLHRVCTLPVEDLNSFYDKDGECVQQAIKDGELRPGEQFPIGPRFKLSPEYRRRFSRDQREMDAADQASEDQRAMEQRRAS